MINSMPVWLWVVIYALAVARLTGLVAKDEITRPVREHLVSRLDTRKGWQRKIAYLVGGATDEAEGCPWCLSIWIAFPAVAVIWNFGGNPWVGGAALALALSQLTGMTASIGRG